LYFVGGNAAINLKIEMQEGGTKSVLVLKAYSDSGNNLSVDFKILKIFHTF
jgi:hypothetical protein